MNYILTILFQKLSKNNFYCQEHIGDSLIQDSFSCFRFITLRALLGLTMFGPLVGISIWRMSFTSKIEWMLHSHCLRRYFVVKSIVLSNLGFNIKNRHLVDLKPSDEKLWLFSFKRACQVQFFLLIHLVPVTYDQIHDVIKKSHLSRIILNVSFQK